MKIKFLSLILISSLFSCDTKTQKSMSELPKAPLAKQIPKNLTIHDDVRVDEFYWLKDRENPEVIDYLNNENDYYNAHTAHTKEFQTSLFEEMKSRIKEDDSSVPYKYNGYWYITKYEKGKDYPIYTRKKESLEAAEELLFDCNEMAKDHSYFRLVGLNINPNNDLVSYGIDTTGRRQYTLHIKDLKTNTIFKDEISNTTGGSTWANDNKTLFYTLKDETTLRSEAIYKHQLNSEQKSDELIFEETDDTFGVSVYKTKSKKYLVIVSYSTLTTEYQVLNANTPDGDFKVFQPRTRGLEYGISHYEDSFYIVSNADGAQNFKLSKTSETQTEKEYWKDVIPHRESVLLEGIEIFKDFLVVSERENGLNQIHIKRWDGAANYYLPFESETYTAYTTTNIDFDTTVLRYGYQSLTTPSSVIDFDMVTKTKTIKKEQEVLGGKFKKENYTSERLWATAADGTKIPVSLIRRVDTEKSSDTPLLLYAYGSYGSTIDPYFSTARLSLLDRGFIFAIAHIRGGEYLGRQWYEDGKLFKKKNTFSDFVDCSKYLIENKYTSAKHHYAMGGSAGGLLMGAVVNLAPELYNGVVAQVPFVDVVTTMLDDSIPLTTGEYDEWGNPNEKDYYEYMKSYSPYDNVTNKLYPNMLVTTGLHDSQVQYWEPAKWVARLRAQSKNASQLYLQTNLEAGHGGASGRFEALKEVAAEYAFLLDLESILK
ncbi:MAG: S9 family peptidase [Flavobacteriaceae bacterium]|nr:S9 family peptidase [Flavobacteriaceae bacterium]MDG1310195.1 S9 family peptidase [Flavobacteriaceae bacterium]